MPTALVYRPANAADSKTRVDASVWAPATGGGYWVVPLDGGPRRIIHVKRKRGVYVEED